MKKSILKTTLLLASVVALLSFDLPANWFKAGSKPNSYDMGIDKGSGKDGTNAATIKSIDDTIHGFGTLMQKIKPDSYTGKRIRMRGSMKSQNVKGWAAFWLRIDQKDSKTPLAFDNMSKRPIKGTTTWAQYEITLDVPKNASGLAFGALLDGTGQIWFDNLKIEIIGNAAPPTKKSSVEPANLNFEK